MKKILEEQQQTNIDQNLQRQQDRQHAKEYHSTMVAAKDAGIEKMHQEILALKADLSYAECQASKDTSGKVTSLQKEVRQLKQTMEFNQQQYDQHLSKVESFHMEVLLDYGEQVSTLLDEKRALIDELDSDGDSDIDELTDAFREKAGVAEKSKQRKALPGEMKFPCSLWR